MILEDLVKQSRRRQRRRLCFMRGCCSGRVTCRNAVAQYKNALEIDPAAADAQLARRWASNAGGRGRPIR